MNQPADEIPKVRRVAFAGAIGNVMEWYCQFNSGLADWAA